VGPKRRITVRKWKNSKLIDIREFWTDNKDGMDKPGKKGKTMLYVKFRNIKGISLSEDQWNTLKSLIDSVDGVLDSI
jgi:Transcriptional Coactivator p15 (PC4)